MFGRLHVAVAHLDPPEAVADGLDPDPIVVADARRIFGLDRQHHVLLVQDLVVLEVVQQGGGRGLGIAGQEHGRALHPMRLALLQHADELGQRHVDLAGLLDQDARAPPPGHHQRDQHRADQERHPAALRDLEGVRGQEDRVDQQERR